MPVMDPETLLRQELPHLVPATASRPSVAALVAGGDRRRRHRRLLSTTALGVGCLAVTGGLTLVPLSGRGPSSVTLSVAGQPGTDNAQSAPATPSTPATPAVVGPSAEALDAATFAHFFFTTGAQATYDATSGFSAYTDRLDSALAPGCTTGGVPNHYKDFPDLDRIARVGLVGGATTKLVAPDCMTELARAQKLDPSAEAESLTDTWYATIYDKTSTLRADADPAVKAAAATIPACAATHGFTVRDEDDFFGLADSLGMTSGSADPHGIALGRAYADCLRPVVAARAPIIAQELASFRSVHATEIAAFEQQLAARIVAAEAATGVPFPTA